MQVKLYTIAVLGGEREVEEMNRFLRSNRILEVKQEFYGKQNAAFWCFSVHYLAKTGETELGSKRKKVDYKNELDEKTFSIFSQLRICRKEIAHDESLPAFAIFTDAELSEMAKLPDLTVGKLQTIKGIGEKKTEKFGHRLLELYQNKMNNEKSGQPDTKNS